MDKDAATKSFGRFQVGGTYYRFWTHESQPIFNTWVFEGHVEHEHSSSTCDVPYHYYVFRLHEGGECESGYRFKIPSLRGVDLTFLTWPEVYAAVQRIGEKPASMGSILPSNRALAIAQADALAAYSDLSPYRIRLALEDDGWHIDYELKDPKLKGGGPHYVIHAFTGAIVSKRYEQ